MAERYSTPESVAHSQVRVKKEDDGDSRDGHSHRFNVRFNPSDVEEYTIYCDQPRTVLEAIKSSKKYNKLKCADENIIIQLGRSGEQCVIPTHFPCCCIEDGELLIISCASEKVEEAQNKPSEIVHPRNMYSVFYIDREGGKNTKTKQLFRSKKIKQFKYACVYGEKGMTVEESLKRDGRFIDDLGDFTLTHNENPNVLTECSQKVDNLHDKKFKLCLPRNKTDDTVRHVAKQRGTSVKTLLENSDSNDTKEIYEILRQQFPHLKKVMEDRFPGDSYEEAVDLRREDFGKIQKSFSEVHRVRKLLKLGESVCKIVVENVCEGTGFVLFDNFILTNAHLFRDCVEGENLQEGIKVFALFNYDHPLPDTDHHCFSVKKTFIDFSLGELDYAVLELNLEDQKVTQTKTAKVPAGLLKSFVPLPQDGKACIIGHPAGDVKQMDPTCIIEKENREQAVDNHLEPNRNSLFMICSISQLIRNQGIENILIGGNQADGAVTYDTFMYHGSSGSPVFDAHCSVFGLHTGGYVYGFANHTESVIEFAQPLLTIFERLVTKIKENGNEELLKRVQEEAKGNSDLEKSFKSLESSRVEEAKGKLIPGKGSNS